MTDLHPFITPDDFAAALLRLNTIQAGSRVAVAVSGGGDSLALTLLLHEWAQKNRVSLVALTAWAATAAFVHRLTPTASFTLTVSDQKTSDVGVLAGNELRLVSAGLSDTLTRLITGTLTLRHARFTSPSQPYTESAIIGSLGMTF